MKKLIISKILTLSQEIDKLMYRRTDSEAHRLQVRHNIELLQAKREILAELFDELGAYEA